MKNLLLGLLVAGVMGLAVWTYSENYATKQTLDGIVQLNKNIATARSKLRVLNAEWAYLNRPERLSKLVNANFDELELLELTSKHFVGLEKIPYRILGSELMVDEIKFNTRTKTP
jgi:hypothetical protein